MLLPLPSVGRRQAGVDVLTTKEMVEAGAHLIEKVVGDLDGTFGVAEDLARDVFSAMVLAAKAGGVCITALPSRGLPKSDNRKKLYLFLAFGISVHPELTACVSQEGIQTKPPGLKCSFNAHAMNYLISSSRKLTTELE